MDLKLPDFVRFQNQTVSKEALKQIYDRYLEQTGYPPKIYLYTIYRCYGGPEEGGWWYNKHYAIAGNICLPEDWDRAWTLIVLLLEAWESEYTSTDIYSVNGREGYDYAFCAYNDDPSSFDSGNEVVRYE